MTDRESAVMSSSWASRWASSGSPSSPAARSTASTIAGSFSATMPSELPGSKVRPEPASDSSRWIVCLPERLPFRLTSSVISAANGWALLYAGAAAGLAKSRITAPRRGSALAGPGSAASASFSSTAFVQSAA